MAIAIPQAPTQYNPVFLTGTTKLYLKSYNPSWGPSNDEKQQSISLNPYFKPSNAIECNDNGCIYFSGILGGEVNKFYEDSFIPYIAGIGWNNGGTGSSSKFLEIYNITYLSNYKYFVGKIRYRAFFGTSQPSFYGIISDPGTKLSFSEHSSNTTSGNYNLNITVE